MCALRVACLHLARALLLALIAHIEHVTTQERASHKDLGGLHVVRQLFDKHCASLQQGIVSAYRSLLEATLRPLVARRLRDEAAAKSEVGVVEGTRAGADKGDADMLTSFAAVEAALRGDPRFEGVGEDTRCAHCVRTI